MSNQKVRVVRIDPWHKPYCLLVPMLAQKISEAMSGLGDEEGVVAVQFMARLWGKDPGVLLLAAIGPDGLPKGFCAAQVMPDGRLVMLQPRLDEPAENDAIAEMIEAVESYAKQNQIKSVELVTRRRDEKFIKKYGFEVDRYYLSKEIM